MTNPNEIQTTQQIFDGLASRGYPIWYQKIPFNPRKSFQYEQVEQLGNAITEHIENDSIIVFNCRQGIHRSTVASCLCILIAYHHGSLAYVDEDDERDEAHHSQFISKSDISFDEHLSGLNPLSNSNETNETATVHSPGSPGDKSPPKMPLATPVSGTPSEHLPFKLTPNDSPRLTSRHRTARSTCHSMALDPKEDSEEEGDEQIGTECRAVLALIRILRKGLLMKNQVDNAIELCSEFYHIKDAIYESRAKWENARTAEESEGYLKEAMKHLRIYTNLICYNAYLYEYYHAKKYNESESTKKRYKLLSFTQWMQSRGELKLWLDKMRQNPQLALSMNQMDFDDEEDDNGFAKVFEQRGKGHSVLTTNAMLKVDYFPGCAQLGTNPEAESAINFRYIDAIGVAGSAIPTSEAIREVVLFCGRKWSSKMGTKQSKKAPIHWINLREEPVLYVNEEPVVLRELHQPYENLVFTGITTKRVEAMESQLCKDAEEECSKFEDKLLIHAESDTGNLMAEWEEVTTANILTTKEAYSVAFQSAIETDRGIETHYHRLPITDEQAPPALIVDTFMELFEENPSDSIFIFNCQMGRGRTTTAMSMYALWKWRCGLSQISIQQSARKSKSDGSLSLSPKGNKSQEMNDRKALINGEYNAVQALLRILPQGIKSKRWCDHVLDVLSHMQNLRKAVYQMQIRGEKAVSEKSKTICGHRAEHYLQRYCLLIAFTSYLLHDYRPPKELVNDNNNNNNEDKNVNEEEQKENVKEQHRLSFAEWLKQRAAVRNCIYSAKLE